MIAHKLSKLAMISLLLLVSAVMLVPLTGDAEDKDSDAMALERMNAHANANPKDIQAMFMRAVMLAEQNRREDAIKAFVEMTERYPHLPEPYNNLAVLYADQGQFDKARKALESAIKTHPSYATAHENLGDIYAKMASEAYDKALQLDTANTRAQTKLALIKDIFVGANRTAIATNKIPDTGKPVQAKPSEPRQPEPLKPMESSRPANVSSIEENKLTTAKNDKSSLASKDTNVSRVSAGDERDSVEASIRKWAAAWSAKQVDAYLASYASSFKPPKDESREAWEQNRRQRINKPGSIQVDISNLQVQVKGLTARVTFKQHYRATKLTQRTNKTLLMVQVDGRWLIEQEITDR